MGNNYCLYHMDCLRAMAQMEDHSVDLVLTDPPYNLGLFMKSRATNLKAMRKNFLEPPGGTTWGLRNGSMAWTRCSAALPGW